jgi:mono/diheme cytochrome c family protein/polyisoprenoid-binding protein YceI
MRKLPNSAPVSKLKLAFRWLRWMVAGAGSALVVLTGVAGLEFAFGSASQPPLQPNLGYVAGPNGPDNPPVSDISGGLVLPDPVHPPTDPKLAAKIAEGKHLVLAGDCESCHSVPGGMPFAGGRAWPMPVGFAIGPNITPSKRFGIGNWTDKQFWNALHLGFAPGRSLIIFRHYLFPIMPYQNLDRLSYSQVMSIRAYLNSIQAVDKPSRRANVWWPANIRGLQWPWRVLFFHPHKLHYAKNWSKQVRNGAFLVRVLAHCSQCHTPRNIAFALEHGEEFHGGRILAQGWYAPNISSSKQYGVGGWPRQELVTYLHDFGDLKHGAPFGPMQEVVSDSLSKLPVSDIEDIAAYMQTATKPKENFHNGVITAFQQRQGAALFAGNCARCHEANAEGVAKSFPNLAHNQAVWNGLPDDIISIVIGGMKPWHNHGSAMPSFRHTLTAQQIAWVSNYVRTNFGNHGAPDATANRVRILRMLTPEKLQVDVSNTAARLQFQQGGNSPAFREVAGELALYPERKHCRLDIAYTVPSLNKPANGAPDLRSAAYFDGKQFKYMRYSGSCADQGSTIDGILTMHGQTHPLTMQVTDIMAGHRLGGLRIAAIIDPAQWGLTAMKPFLFTNIISLDGQAPQASST